MLNSRALGAPVRAKEIAQYRSKQKRRVSTESPLIFQPSGSSPHITVPETADKLFNQALEAKGLRHRPQYNCRPHLCHDVPHGRNESSVHCWAAWALGASASLDLCQVAEFCQRLGGTGETGKERNGYRIGTGLNIVHFAPFRHKAFDSNSAILQNASVLGGKPLHSQRHTNF